MSTSSSGNSNKDNVFDLDSNAFASDHFRMYEFKVKRCPRARPHDWTQCPFAHPGEKARRRDPRRYRYSGTACPEFRKSGCCRRGDACPFAHGVFECWLHPSRYRTQLCTDGQSCKRRVCFFAHSESELRRPEDDPVTAERQVQAELAAEVQVLQQQHLAQALQTILDASNMGNGNGTAPAATSSPLFALELLKQVTMPQSTSMTGTTDSAEGANGSTAAAALLQQLGILQQTNQQQESQTPQAAKVEEQAALKPAEELLGGSNSQGDIQEALKQVLEQQLPKPAATAVSAPESTPTPEAATSQSENLTAANPTIGGTLPLDNSQLMQLDPAILSSLLGQPSMVQSNMVQQNMVQQNMLQQNMLQQNLMRARAAPTSNRHSIDNSFLASKILGMSGQMSGEGQAQGAMLPVHVSQGLAENGHASRRSLDSFMNPMMDQAPPASQPSVEATNGVSLEQPADASQVMTIQQPYGNGGAVAGVPFDQNPALSAQLFQMDPTLLNLARARQQGFGTLPNRMMDNQFLSRNVDMSGIVNGVVAQTDLMHPQMIVSGVPVPTPEANNGFAQNGALMAQAQALIQCLSLDQAQAQQLAQLQLQQVQSQHGVGQGQQLQGQVQQQHQPPQTQQQQLPPQVPQQQQQQLQQSQTSPQQQSQEQPSQQLSSSQQPQFSMMGGFDKGLQHERVNSGGNEAPALMQSNILQ